MLLRYRRTTAAVLIVLGAVLMINSLIPSTPSTRVVLVAAKDLASGEALTASSVKAEHVPESVLNSQSISDVAELDGEIMAAALPAGAPLYSSLFLGPGLLEHIGTGMVAVPINPSDPRILSLLRAGAQVKIMASDEGGFSENQGTILADAATILWVEQDEQGSLMSSGASAGLVMVAVPEQIAGAILAAHNSSRIDVVLMN